MFINLGTSKRVWCESNDKPRHACARKPQPWVYVLQDGVDCRTCKSNNVIIAVAAAVFINAKLLHQNHQTQSISLVCGNFFAHTRSNTDARTRHDPTQNYLKLFEFFGFILFVIFLGFFVAHFSFSYFKMREREREMKLVLLLSLFCNRHFYFVDNNFQRVYLHFSKASLLFSKMYAKPPSFTVFSLVSGCLTTKWTNDNMHFLLYRSKC